MHRRFICYEDAGADPLIEKNTITACCETGKPIQTNVGPFCAEEIIVGMYYRWPDGVFQRIDAVEEIA